MLLSAFLYVAYASLSILYVILELNLNVNELANEQVDLDDPQ